MKKFRKSLVVFAIVLFALYVGLATYKYQFMSIPYPDYNKEITLKGLTSEVKVYRDQFAIPHIYAQNEEDLYYTVGYVLSQDRLWQMDLLRRVTQGRLSEIFGEDMVNTDHLLRSLRFSKKSAQILDTLNENEYLALKAFSKGVNAFIDDSKNKLSIEFRILGYKPEYWEPEHSINLIGYMAWDLKAGWNQIMLEKVRAKVGDKMYSELLPDATKQNKYVFNELTQERAEMAEQLYNTLKPLKNLGVEVFNASNNWAVSGDKTESGKPLFANDMHLGLNIPGIWFQMHQVVEGKLNVTGLVLPGQPFVISGHNDKIAWGMTNTYVDNMDFYSEKLNNEGTQYFFNNEWHDLLISEETITIKKQEPVKKVIKYTHRGPVVSDFKNFEKSVSMTWVGEIFSNEIHSIYQLNRAQNWNEFTDALKTFISISQNINYADVEGNIGLFCAAGVPVRKRDIGFGILPGDTDEYDWKGIIPFDELPREYNPSRKYVSSANNRTVDDNYPHHIGTWYTLPYRFNRINEMLKSENSFTVDKFKEIQTDRKSTKAVEYLKILSKIMRGNMSNMNEAESTVFASLQSWDGEMSADGFESLVFETYILNLVENLYKDEMGEDLFGSYLATTKLPKLAIENVLKDNFSYWSDDVTTSDKVENLEDIVLKSYQETISLLTEKYGSNIEKWEWGKEHQLTLEHPMGSVKILDKVFKLNRGPYALSGSYHTVSPYSYKFNEAFKVFHGASHRHIYDVGNWDKSVTVIPTGNSGNAGSIHYCDQTELYVNDKYHADYFSLEKIKENAMYEMSFVSAISR